VIALQRVDLRERKKQLTFHQGATGLSDLVHLKKSQAVDWDNCF
jgi:hypothetical protein